MKWGAKEREKMMTKDVHQVLDLNPCQNNCHSCCHHQHPLLVSPFNYILTAPWDEWLLWHCILRRVCPWRYDKFMYVSSWKILLEYSSVLNKLFDIVYIKLKFPQEFISWICNLFALNNKIICLRNFFL